MTDSDGRTRSEALAEAVQRRLPGGGSLASGAWRLSARDGPEPPTQAVLTPTDGAGRIVLTAAEEDFIDVDPTIEVYLPPDDSDGSGRGRRIAAQTFDGPELTAAVWLAEYYARRRDEPPSAGADWVHGDAFADAVREAVTGGGSLASDVWRFSESDTQLDFNRVVWTHRDTGGRIMLTMRPPSSEREGLMMEVLVPAPRDDAARQDPDDVNDMTVVYQPLDGLSLAAAVWLAEHYARKHDDMVPANAPPVDVDVSTDEAARTG
jgi:hypothetical protein